MTVSDARSGRRGSRPPASSRCSRSSSAPQRATRRARCASRAAASPHAGAVYAHYVYKGARARRCGSASTHGACGSFSRRSRQFPFKARPTVGRWTIQFDQQRHYSPVAPVFVRLPIKVSRTIGQPLAQITIGSASRPCGSNRRSLAVGVHDGRVAGARTRPRAAERQRVDQPLLDHALERPGAVRRVVAEVAEQRRGRRRSARRSIPRSAHADDQARHLQVDDLRRAARGVSGVELDDVVQAVDELGLEAAPPRPPGRPGCSRS